MVICVHTIKKVYFIRLEEDSVEVDLMTLVEHCIDNPGDMITRVFLAETELSNW